MKRCGVAFSILLIVSSAAVQAKTSAQRVTELAGLLPSGMEMRAVWLQNGALKAMSSLDGNIRTLVSSDCWMPNLTHDGSRVVYVKSESDCYVIGWNGQNDRKVYSSGEAVRYWRDRTNNTDWAIGTDRRRVNIDQPSQTQTLWTGTPSPSICDYTPLSLSRDGTRVGGHFPHPWFGVGVVSSGPIYIEKTLESCYATMAPDNSYDIMVQDGPHTTLYVRSSSGAAKSSYPISSTILAWARSNGGVNSGSQDCTQDKFEDARWGNNRNYAILQMWGTKGNPWVVRLTDMKFMYFDELTCTSGGVARCPDMVILPEDPVGVAGKAAPVASVTSLAADNSGDVYSLQGQRLNRAIARSGSRTGGVPGIAIRRNGDTGTEVPMSVVLP